MKRTVRGLRKTLWDSSFYYAMQCWVHFLNFFRSIFFDFDLSLISSTVFVAQNWLQDIRKTIRFLWILILLVTLEKTKSMTKLEQSLPLIKTFSRVAGLSIRLDEKTHLNVNISSLYQGIWQNILHESIILKDYKNICPNWFTFDVCSAGLLNEYE